MTLCDKVAVGSSLVVGLLLSFCCAVGAEPGRDTRCYELRTYYAAEGKLDALHARFRDHTMRLFEKHGMVNLGYWVPVDNTEGKLIYLLVYGHRAAREVSWKSFMADPEWQAAHKASEVGGRLVAKVESVLMEATDYSPVISVQNAPEPRLFEMRVYTAAPGRLDALHARFRDHTTGLFDRHKIGQFGYWSPMKDQKGAADTLIYLLMHPNREAAERGFEAFRADPEWLAARKASEDKAGGSLTLSDGVVSIFLRPTDYSPTK
jgi:hypothetical protein